MTWMSLCLTLCRSIRFSLVAGVFGLLTTSLPAGEDPPPAYDKAPHSPRPQSDTQRSHQTASMQVRFVNPAGMRIGLGRAFAENQLTTPGRYNFRQRAIYRLKVSNIPGREGMTIFSTLLVYPAHPTTDAYVSHNSVPIEISDDDLNQIAKNKSVTKVVFLPDPKFQDLSTAGVETLVATDFEPGAGPVAEAERRGTILLVLRLGNTDDDIPASLAGELALARRQPAAVTSEWALLRRPGLIAPPDVAAETQPTDVATPSAPEDIVKVTAHETEMQITESLSRIVEPDFPIHRVDGFDPEIVDVEAVAPNRIRVKALLQGVTNIVLSNKDGRTCQLNIYVAGDTRHLQAIIDSRFPDASVKTYKVQNTVALTGSVNRPEDISGIVDLCEQFSPQVLNHLQVAGVTGAQIQQTGSFGEIFPTAVPAPSSVAQTNASPTEPASLPSWWTATPENERINQMRQAIKSLQAAGLTEQVRAVEREIEKEQIARKEREVEELQRQIQTMRRRLGVPASIPEVPLPAATP